MPKTTYRAAVCVCVTAACGAFAAAQAPPTPMSDSPPPVVKQVQDPGPPLTLGQAIDEALQKNPVLIALRREFDAVRQRPAQARFLSPPTFTAQIWQWPINTISPQNVNMYMFMVEQDIPGRGKRDLQEAVAQRDADLSGNEIAIAARQTIADLKHAYTTLLVARKTSGIYTETAALLRQLADVSESKYVSGRISQQDVLKPAVELSKLHDDELMSRQQGNLASAQLNLLLGRDPGAPIGPLMDPETTAPLPAVDALIQMAIDHQPALQAARLGIDRAKADVAVARSDTKPDFMVQGGYMLMPRGTDAWTGQFGITWPSAPWSRGRVEARLAEATAEVSAANARLLMIESQLRLAVQQAYVRVTTAQQRAALLRGTIEPQSRQALDAARIGYETDRVDFLTVLENQRMLLNEQLDYIRVIGDLTDARADLERAVGVDLDSGPAAAVGVNRERQRP
jgi:outer membrane protein, heavy metal efflux system